MIQISRHDCAKLYLNKNRIGIVFSANWHEIVPVLNLIGSYLDVLIRKKTESE